ncbi:MAG: hypothetical protein M1828_002780 [Chrysothrix sp. TS-e1954]|nr:MAG: hypothetical protein M1828_002780 [Chrysothrix sp. TS-e1954]
MSPTEFTKDRFATWPQLKGPEQAAGGAICEQYVKDQIAVGATHIKLFHEDGSSVGMNLVKPSVELQKAVVDAAHAHGLPVVAHALAYKCTIEALQAGGDGMTHTFIDKATSDEYVQLYLRNKAHCNPTLGAAGSLTAEGASIQDAFAHDPSAARLFIDKESSEATLCACMSVAKETGSVENAYASVKALYKAGVPIIVGSDASRPVPGTAFGLSVHMEMHQLAHKVGMDPLDGLKAATSITASRFNFHDRGTIEKGKKADLVLIEGNVVEHLKDDKKLLMPLRGVWRDGVIAKQWESLMV